MGTMNISLPDSLRDFVDLQVSSARYGTSSEYVRELIRRDQDRLQLRALMLEGAQSAPTGIADDTYFATLRKRATPRAPAKRRA
jgi:antitoxin ParD1/3/4